MELTPAHLAHTMTYGGARLNIYHADVGHGLSWHSHAYSHAVICHAGACKVRKGKKEVMLKKGSTPVNLPAAEPHEIEVVENDTVFVTVFAEGKM
jgi:quercetin dioxygenase-like cupin family protein